MVPVKCGLIIDIYQENTGFEKTKSLGYSADRKKEFHKTDNKMIMNPVLGLV